MDVMKLINDTNRITTVQEAEQWTVRGSPNGMAITIVGAVTTM
jgi:hypothetical protein